METTLTFYSRPIAEVPYFKYLGRVIYSSKNDWLEVVHNLRKVWSNWARLLRVLRREMEDARTLEMFYVMAVQSVLIYRLEMWVMSPHIVKTLGAFHRRVVCRLTEWQTKRRMNETCDYYPLVEVMAGAGIQDVET